MKPKVSIIIPVYNGSNYLKEAIDSAIAQTYKNIEILVINDGSNDNGKTAKIARSFGKKIRYFEKENGGVASALNFGIKKMKGEYFSWLSHDDIYYPDKIACQLKFLKQCPKRTVLYSDFELINGKGRHLRMFKFKPPPAHFIYYLIDEKFIHGCTVFVAKQAFQEVGLFNEKLKNVCDYEMWYRLIKKGYHFYHLRKVLINARIHSGQDTKLQWSRQLYEEDNLYLWVLKNLPLEAIFSSVEDCTAQYLYLAKKFKKIGLFKAANYSRLLAWRYLKIRNIRRHHWRLFIDSFKKN